MNKKAITILGAIFLLIVGTIGFLLYQRSKSKTQETTPPPPVAQTTPPPATTENPPPSEELPPPDTQNPPPANTQGSTPIKLTDGKDIVSPVLFYQGNGISYFNSQGQLFQADLNSDSGLQLENTRELTVPLKAGVTKVLWPQSGNNYIIQYKVGDRDAWSVYVADKGEYVDLPSQVTSINWMPTGDKILYVWLDKAGKATLNIANPDNTGYQVITDFWESDDAISISPDGKTVLFFETKKPDSPNPINMVTADGKVFKSLVKDGYNKDVVWSPDSKKFMFFRKNSGSNDYGLWVANISSGEIKSMDITSALDKVAWSADSQSVFAAVPTGQGQDIFYKVDLASGDKTKFDPGPSIDARDLFLSGPQDYLFFRNAADNQLYGLLIVGSNSSN